MFKTRLAAALLAVAAALVAVLIYSGAAPAKDLQSKLHAQEAKLSKVEARKGVLTTTISHYRDRIERLTTTVAALRNQEAAVRARLNVKQAELNQAVAQLDVAKRHLSVVKARLKRALVALRDRLVAMYESGTPDMLSVIVSSHGYDDLITRTEYLNQIRGMDEAVVGRVRDLRDQVKNTVARLRSAKDTIESARDAIAAEESALAQARASVQDRQAALVSTRRQREAALQRIRSHEEELDGSVAAIQGKIAAQLAGMGSTPLPAGPIRGGSSGLIWPVDGPVVSGFGPRTINGSYEYHPGIDIGVPEGTPIRAAASGSVSLQQSEAESGGYGNFTCIDHGGGLATCYAHQSAFGVSLGQSVSQGSIIGYTGCTGYCFGPHLHFEVRVNGAPVDPLGYL